MPLIYYWRPDNYARDRVFGFGYHLNQNSRVMESAFPGDRLWAFTRRKADGLYVLAAELVVRAVTRNPHNYRYGAYRIWGDLEKSRYFAIDAGPNAEPLIRHLSISAHGNHLGQAFQGHAAVRNLTPTDHLLLTAFARSLTLAEKVGIYPEDEFEARLLHGDVARELLVREAQPDSERRMAYLYETTDVHRARRNIEFLQELYGGQCQLCQFSPCDEYGLRLCHGHHVQWLSRGGDDEVSNMVLVCPNHHAAIHRDDAIFDYGSLAFAYSNGRSEVIQLNRHLPKVG